MDSHILPVGDDIYPDTGGEPQLIAFGYQAIDRHTLKAIKAFIHRHRAALLRHWQGETDSVGVLTELGLRGPAEKTFQKT